MASGQAGQLNHSSSLTRLCHSLAVPLSTTRQAHWSSHQDSAAAKIVTASHSTVHRRDARGAGVASSPQVREKKAMAVPPRPNSVATVGAPLSARPGRTSSNASVAVRPW